MTSNSSVFFVRQVISQVTPVLAGQVMGATVTIRKLLGHLRTDVRTKEKAPFSVLDIRVDSVIH